MRENRDIKTNTTRLTFPKEWKLICYFRMTFGSTYGRRKSSMDIVFDDHGVFKDKRGRRTRSLRVESRTPIIGTSSATGHVPFVSLSDKP